MNLDKYILKFGKFKHHDEVRNILYIVDYAKEVGCTKAQIAYILATCYHECYNWKTGTHFIPIKEIGSAEYFIRKYFINPIQRKWLGNDTADEAVKYCGRGFVMITGEKNYEIFGIADKPEVALDYKKATEILVKGMMNGMFTGYKLRKYVVNDLHDAYFARKTVNSLDKAHLIENYAKTFYDIL